MITFFAIQANKQENEKDEKQGPFQHLSLPFFLNYNIHSHHKFHRFFFIELDFRDVISPKGEQKVIIFYI